MKVHAHRRVVCIPHPEKDLVFIATPKVGNTSLRDMVGHQAQVAPEKLRLYKRVLVFVRDPLERLESAFNYFTERNSFPSAWEEASQSMIQHSPETIQDFINLILDRGWYDKHWVPQTYLWEVLECDLEYHLFEDFSTVTGREGLAVLHSNRSETPKQGIKYRLPELREFYKADIALRERLLNE